MPSRIDVSTLPRRYQAQISAQTGKRPTEAATPEARATIAAEGGIMLRQSSVGMNKTEALFFAHLRASQPGAWIEREPVALKLGNGVRYNPDFLVSTLETIGPGKACSAQLTAYEVKGYMRDDAAVKIKVAARMYPFIRFVLVWRDGRDGWKQQEITA